MKHILALMWLHISFSSNQWLSPKQWLITLTIPIVVIKIRILQWRLKRVIVNNYDKQSNEKLNKAKRFQFLEYCREQQFKSWGKYHKRFCYDNKQSKKHSEAMSWLFPIKDYEMWDIVVWYNPRAVTFYHNKIYRYEPHLSYHTQINNQLSKWRTYESK